MAEKYHGWCMWSKWQGLMYWSYFSTRTEVVKWWDSLTDENYRNGAYKWRNLRKHGTHKIVKVRLVEVDDAS